MRNFFKVVRDGEEMIAFNHMENAFMYFTMGYAYAKVMAIIGEGHRLDKSVNVVGYNDNVDSGELKVTYSVNITAMEFPYKIENIGFAPFASAPLSNSCTVSVEPGTMTIYGTIYLSTTGNDFVFYPASNPLVRSLLGMEALGSINVKGGNSLLNAPGLIKGEYTQISSSKQQLDGLDIFFETGDKTDFVVYVNDLPCLKFNLAYFKGKPVDKKMTSKGGFFAPDAVSVTEVNGKDNINFYPVLAEVFETGARKVTGLDGYELFGDPLYRRAGLKNGKDFYYIDDGSLSLTKGGEYKGELIMCSDGEVISYSDGTLDFFRMNKQFTVQHGQTVALFNNGGYDIFVLSGGSLYIYRCDEEVVLSKNISSVDGTLSRANDYSVIVSDKSNRRIFTADGEASFEFAGLSSIEDEEVRDGCYYGEGYMGSFLSYDRIICDKAMSRFCNYEGKLHYVGENGVVTVLDEEADDAITAGSAVIVLKNGTLTFYRGGFDGVYVSVPQFDLVDYKAYEYNSGGSVTLEIKQQGE